MPTNMCRDDERRCSEILFDLTIGNITCINIRDLETFLLVDIMLLYCRRSSN